MEQFVEKNKVDFDKFIKEHTEKKVLKYKKNAIKNIWKGYVDNLSGSKRQWLLRIVSNTARKKLADSKSIANTLKEEADKVESKPEVENKSAKKNKLNSFLHESEKKAPEQMFLNFIALLMINEIAIEKADNIYKIINLDYLKNKGTDLKEGKLPNTRRFNLLVEFLSNDPYLFMLFEQELRALVGEIDELQFKDGSKNSKSTELDVLRNLYITVKSNILNDLSNIGKSKIMKELIKDREDIINSINSNELSYNKILEFENQCLSIMQLATNKEVMKVVQEELNIVKSRQESYVESITENFEQQLLSCQNIFEQSGNVNSLYALGAMFIKLNEEYEKNQPLLKQDDKIKYEKNLKNFKEILIYTINNAIKFDNVDENDLKDLESHINNLKQYIENYENFLILKTKGFALLGKDTAQQYLEKFIKKYEEKYESEIDSLKNDLYSFDKKIQDNELVNVDAFEKVSSKTLSFKNEIANDKILSAEQKKMFNDVIDSHFTKYIKGSIKSDKLMNDDDYKKYLGILKLVFKSQKNIMEYNELRMKLEYKFLNDSLDALWIHIDEAYDNPSIFKLKADKLFQKIQVNYNLSEKDEIDLGKACSQYVILMEYFEYINNNINNINNKNINEIKNLFIVTDNAINILNAYSEVFDFEKILDNLKNLKNVIEKSRCQKINQERYNNTYRKIAEKSKEVRKVISGLVKIKMPKKGKMNVIQEESGAEYSSGDEQKNKQGKQQKQKQANLRKQSSTESLHEEVKQNNHEFMKE